MSTDSCWENKKMAGCERELVFIYDFLWANAPGVISKNYVCSYISQKVNTVHQTLLGQICLAVCVGLLFYVQNMPH